MEYIVKLLEDLHDEMPHKDMFLPLVLANSIVCYQLVMYDKNYWMEFCKKASDPDITLENLEDMYQFFEVFLSESPQFEFSYEGRIKHLKIFESFFQDFYFRQKYFFKYPSELENEMQKFTWFEQDITLVNFAREFLDAASRIRYIR